MVQSIDPGTWVAVISGASKGIGRGTAIALGARGATVYVTGRSGAGGASRDPSEPPALPGTVDEVAQLVTAAGGRGIPVICDMGDDAQIESLFRRVQQECGRLDILVNNAAYFHKDVLAMPRRPFWEKSVRLADSIGVGLRCHYVAMYHAVPLMLAAKRGLIVNISFYGEGNMHDPAYHAAKTGLDAMASSAAVELAPHGVAAISLWPGIVATERVRSVTPDNPEMAEQLATFETPEFIGNVIAKLYGDPDLMALSGKTLIAAEMAEHYGITDANGRQPMSYRGIFGMPRREFDRFPERQPVNAPA